MAVEVDETLDCIGLSCPMPVIKLAKRMKKMDVGKVLELLVTDPGSKDDVPGWCKKTGNELIESLDEEGGAYKFYVRRVK